MLDPLAYRAYYHRRLPHYQPPEATLFLTFRLHGSLPAEVLDRLKAEAEENERRIEQTVDKADQNAVLYTEYKRQFGRYDAALDAAAQGPHWLKDERVAHIVNDALLFRDSKVYELDCFTIMSNHVHAVFAPLKDETGSHYSLKRIM